MNSLRGWTLILASLLILALLPSPAGAQARGMSELRHTVAFGPWFTTVTAVEPGGAGSWRTTLWVLDYHLTSERPWGFHLRFGTGGQTASSFGGIFAGASPGSDRLWSADVSYRIRSDQATVRVFAGYSSITWEFTLPGPTARRVNSSGLRVGVNLSMPLQFAAGPAGLSLNADLAWSPSNSVRSLTGTTETVSSGGATEWSISLVYKFPPRGRSSQADYVPATFTLQQDFDPSWRAEIGNRSTSFRGSDYSWSGFFISLGKTF